MRRSFAVLAASSLFAFALPPLACSSSPATGGGGSGAGTGASGGGGSPADAGPDAPPVPSICTELGVAPRAFSQGPYGIHRREIADDFTLDLVGEEPFVMSERWNGCESYVFVPDSLVVSTLDKTSIWEQGVDKLIKQPAKNVHYFFVSRASSDDAANTSTSAMRARIDASLGKLAQADADHWRPRLHVVQKRSVTIGGWLGEVLKGHGRVGFTIDRRQRIRGMGYLADVALFDPALDQAGEWPWKSNLAYAAHEARFFNWEEAAETKLDNDGATVVTLWQGEVLAEFEEIDVVLPSAAEMANFDTLQIEVWMACPDQDEVEFAQGNCGDWDYIASLGVRDPAMNNVEIARFITSYHRESHWIVDASPMLVHLKDGGTQHFRWDFAPSWNTQPTSTYFTLRFSNQSKGYKPAEATFLWSGGPFTSMYDTLHAPMNVPIPADATRVELWSILTGHGADTGQCAEFCNHQHEITVNGKAYLREHKEAGTQSKCVAHTDQGMTPNQPGTWWFGRGGWCPGQQVDPWVVDVTADVTPGMDASLSYRGLYKSMTPPDNAGNIDLTSYLVVYK